MNERDLLVDCLRRLNRTKLTYYLTGSMASNYWGIPRTTHDLDFVIQFPLSAVSSLVEEFQGDYYLDESAVRAAYQPPYQFNAIDTRSSLKVDFWLPKAEPFDREMLQRKVPVNIFGESAWICTPEDLILHKLIWNRITPSELQLRDAAGVLAVQAKEIDQNYLEKWASSLNVSRELNELLTGVIRPKNT